MLASYEGHPVAIREGTVLASAFHPELTDDPRFHAIFMAMTTSARERARRGDGAMSDPRTEGLAKILVGYSTEVKEGEVVSIDGESAAAPLLLAVYEEVLKAGANPVLNVALDGQIAAYFKHATDAQLEWISPFARVDGRQRRRADRDRRQHQHPRALAASPRSARPCASRSPAT